MKIGIICYPTMGGSGAVAMDLAYELGKRGHEIHVISYAMPFRMEETSGLHFHEVEVPSYPLFKYPPYDMALASKLAEVTTAHSLEILHAHYAIPHSMAAFLAKEMVGEQGVKVVTTLHGTDITLVGTDPSYRTATRFALKKSQGITAVSHYLAERTSELCGGCAPIDVIYNFVDPKKYHPHPDRPGREQFAHESEAVLVHMSNFRPVKRIADVVRIFQKVNESLPARLLMVGDGPDRVLAEDLAHELRLAGRIHFLGPRPNVVPILAFSDAFLLPSDGESFGLAALEAMACGIPVVGARAGGLPEVVEDGVSGILEPLGATERMGERLVQVLGNRNAARAMGEAARERAVSCFAADQIVPKYEALYERALGGGTR